MALIYQKDNLIITDDFILKLGEKEISLTEIGRVEIVNFPHLKYWLWVLAVIGILMAYSIASGAYEWISVAFILFAISCWAWSETAEQYPFLKLFSRASGREIAGWQQRKNAKEEKEIIEGLIK